MKVTAKCGNNHLTKLDPEFDELICQMCGEPLKIEATKSKKKIIIVLVLIIIGLFILWPKGPGPDIKDYSYKFSFKSGTNELFIKKSNTANPNNYEYYANGFAEMSKFNFYFRDNSGFFYPVAKKQIRQTQNGKAGQFVICDDKAFGSLFVEGVNNHKYKGLGAETNWEGKSLYQINGAIIQMVTKNIDDTRDCFKLPIRLNEVIAELGPFGILKVKLNDSLHKSNKRKFKYILNNSIVSKVNRFELCKIKMRPDISIITVYEEGVDTSKLKPIKSDAISTTKEKCNCCMRQNEIYAEKQIIINSFKDLEKNCSDGIAIGKATSALPLDCWIEHPTLKDISDTNIKNGKIQWSNFVTLCVIGRIPSVKINNQSFQYSNCPDSGQRLVGLKLDL